MVRGPQVKKHCAGMNAPTKTLSYLFMTHLYECAFSLASDAELVYWAHPGIQASISFLKLCLFSTSSWWHQLQRATILLFQKANKKGTQWYAMNKTSQNTINNNYNSNNWQKKYTLAVFIRRGSVGNSKNREVSLVIWSLVAVLWKCRRHPESKKKKWYYTVSSWDM